MRPSVPSVAMHLLSLKREQWLGRDELERMQRHRLERLAQAACRTGYYGRLLEELKLRPGDVAEDLSCIPLTERDAIYESPESFIREGLTRDALRRLETSGSSGKPVETFYDQECFDYRIALGLHVDSEFGSTPKDITAIISRQPGANHPLFSRLGLFRKVFLPIAGDNERNVRQMLEGKVTVLNTIPSCAAVLASASDRMGRPVRLRRAICSGEMFWKGWRDAICEIFSCDAFDIYGSTEFHCMGWECPEERRMHVASGASVVEIVDGKGRPSSSGELAITCLHNRAMPLLRYRIGDKARWGRGCACGRQMPVLEAIDGSQEDLLVLPSGRLRSATSIRPTVSLSVVREFQIVQEREGLIVFRYVPAKEAMTDAIRQELTRVIADGCQGEEVRVEFEEAESIDRTKGGKLKMFVSKVRARLFT